MQNKKQSAIETIASTLIGFIVSLVLVNIVLPLFGFNVMFNDSFFITLIFTVASIVRGYYVRRYFNYINRNKYLNKKVL